MANVFSYCNPPLCVHVKGLVGNPLDKQRSSLIEAAAESSNTEEQQVMLHTKLLLIVTLMRSGVRAEVSMLYYQRR